MGKFLIEVKEYLCELGCFVVRLRLLLRLWVEEPESWMRRDLHVGNRTSIRESIDGTLGGKLRLREFEGKLRQFAGTLRVGGEMGFGFNGYWISNRIKGMLMQAGLLCTTAEAAATAAEWVGGRALDFNGYWVWVGLRAIGHFFLDGLRGRRLLLRLWVEEPEIWMREGLHVPNQTSTRESIDGTMGGKMRQREFEGKLGQFARILRVGLRAIGPFFLAGLGWAGGFLIEVKEYFCKLGYLALWQRQLLRMWEEEPESWMRGDLHVPNRTSIRESIDGTLDGKMKLLEFKGKLGQFVKILRVGGDKGFGL
ncbi:Hypothetical predicted protein [Olea europaea subsp. europaea]|uniref:Uncharacterized protein n=1 Tax=Olea europaea subsp. europaea TaxID=158383 RepID=A0A8S0R4Z0_OLEEU|nr:Hypothetical predicted protein [Olea europaea subsp. europaea]